MEIPKSIQKLNHTLGLALGRNPRGEPLYRWAWTEDLFWPAMPTGAYEEIQTPSGLYVMGAVKKRVRMTDKYREQWIMTRWIPPNGFSDAECTQMGITRKQLPVWERDFPGAEYPSEGYYFHIAHSQIQQGDLPNEKDTRDFIGGILAQYGLSAAQHEYEWLRGDAMREDIVMRETQAAIANDFTAYLKVPGSVDGEISFGGVGDSPALRKPKSTQEGATL